MDEDDVVRLCLWLWDSSGACSVDFVNTLFSPSVVFKLLHALYHLREASIGKITIEHPLNPAILSMLDEWSLMDIANGDPSSYRLHTYGYNLAPDLHNLDNLLLRSGKGRAGDHSRDHSYPQLLAAPNVPLSAPPKNAASQSNEIRPFFVIAFSIIFFILAQTKEEEVVAGQSAGGETGDGAVPVMADLTVLCQLAPPDERDQVTEVYGAESGFRRGCACHRVTFGPSLYSAHLSMRLS
jgi:hypothetical protein